MTWLENSARYSVGGVLLALVCAVPAGYGLALTEFIGRRVLLTITLVVMIMPASALVLPLFLEVNLFHLENTAWSVVLPFSFFPFGVYLCYIFFSSTIPRDLLAAARVDGASEWGVFRRVALPLARPIVALVGFFAFVSDWTNFFLPYVMFYSDRQYPLAGRPGVPRVFHVGFQPGHGCEREPRPAAGAGHGDTRRHRSGLHRLSLCPAGAGHRDACRGNQGMTSCVAKVAGIYELVACT